MGAPDLQDSVAKTVEILGFSRDIFALR